MALLRKAQTKILTPREAETKFKRFKGRLVFTNGCFDILHAGHTSYLESARQKGDFLLVAVDTDASVRKLKGPTRPLNSLRDRLRVLAALECVDGVTWFGNGNPVPLIERLKPQVLVKGGDWKPSQIAGAPLVRSWGGKVHSISLLKGRSTTRMVQKIKRR